MGGQSRGRNVQEAKGEIQIKTEAKLESEIPVYRLTVMPDPCCGWHPRWRCCWRVWRDVREWPPTTWRGTGPASLRSWKTDIRTVRSTSSATVPRAQTWCLHAARWKLSTPSLHFTGLCSYHVYCFIPCVDVVGSVTGAFKILCRLSSKVHSKTSESWNVYENWIAIITSKYCHSIVGVGQVGLLSVCCFWGLLTTVEEARSDWTLIDWLVECFDTDMRSVESMCAL